MDDATAFLITVSGRDRPGVTAALCEALAATDARLLDLEQVVVRDRLTLGILVSPGRDEDATRDAVTERAAALGMNVEFEAVSSHRPAPDVQHHYVTVLGQPLRTDAMAGISRRITEVGGNIERIARLSRYPILSFELLVADGDADKLRTALASEAAAQHVDVAVQEAGLYRRAKRLVCMDVDSTLVQGELIEALADRAGCGDEVARITGEAMAGDMDFEESLRRRVALLEGLPATALDEVRDCLVLTPGARTLVRTLRRLGYVLAIVSGGFTQLTDTLKDELGLDYAAANTLEVVDGKLTGRLVGDVVDRAAKAELLASFAAEAGVPLSQTVAVGDGANDLDMLNRAGLGIAFNAKPAVREAADTAVSVPYLDAILFLLGLSGEEIEAAQAEDSDVDAGVPGREEV